MISDYKTVQVEEKDLSKKCDRLSIFINTTRFEELPKRQRILLAQQLSFMQAYLRTLSERLWFMREDI